MPRAFLIKSRNERKRSESGDENESREREQVAISNNSQDTLEETSDAPAQVSERKHPQAVSDTPTKQDHAEVRRAEEEKPSVSQQKEAVRASRGKTKAKRALKEVQVGEAPQSKKPRKRAPKRSSIYYYQDESEEAVSGESEREGDESATGPISFVPTQCHGKNENLHDSQACSSAVRCKEFNPHRTTAESYCYARQTKQLRCQENSTQFEFHKIDAQQRPEGHENKPITPPAQVADDKENQINEGLDNVKIVEYHSISNDIEVVYPDFSRPQENSVPENRNVEEYYRTSASVPSQTDAREAEQTVAIQPPTSATAPPQPVIHYVPVFAVQGPNGVYYEPVPGAPHVVQNGPQSQYGCPQPGQPQPVQSQQQQQPVQATVQQLPPHTAPQQLPPQTALQQLPPQTASQQLPPQTASQQLPPQMPPHQLMQQTQLHQLPPQQLPQPLVHRQTVPSKPGTALYPTQQPYNPPTSAQSGGPHYTQRMETAPYPPVSSPYAVGKPAQAAPRPQYHPPAQAAMTTQTYPAQMPAPAPSPQPYAVPPQSGPMSTQFPLQITPYPPASQSTTLSQAYPPQAYPPATQGQVMQHYSSSVSQPYPQQAPRSAIPVHSYPPQPQQVAQTSQMYQPSQAPPPYPHAVVAPQLHPADKSGPMLSPPYPMANQGQPQANPPPTTQPSYYPVASKAATMPVQHPSGRPAPLPVQLYPIENGNGLPTPQYTPGSTESQPKFAYAPPPVNFLQSPVYRVPEQSKGVEVAGTTNSVPAPEQEKTVKGSRRRKTTVPHRGMRDIATSPESYRQQHHPLEGSEKSSCHGSPLNKSSCIITPPGSPEDYSGGMETYTVVMRDRGIQTRLPEMEPRWCPTKRLWKMEPKSQQTTVQQAKSEKNHKMDEPQENGSLSPEPYSPTQKENMYIPEENQHTGGHHRAHGMRRGRGRKGHSSARYHCKFCKKGFQWHSHFTSHERTHTGEKPFQCSECSRAFTRADGLQCHMIVHNKKKPFKCQFCGKGFSDNTLLEKHVYSHTGVKPFKCEYCGRAFTDSQSIDKHLLVHTGTKPYKCQYCVRSFNDSQMLVRHIRSHTGEKPYKCSHCPMAFSKQSALVIHTRVHTGEKPYKCPSCPKSFSISGNLQRHILIHTGERPYKCSKCPKAFNNPSHLSRHISKLHAPQAMEKKLAAIPLAVENIKVEANS